MSSLIYEITVYAVEALISGIFLLHILEAKFPKFFQLIVWCQIVIISLFATPEFSIIRIIFIAILELVFTVFLYEDRLPRKIKYFAFKESIVIASSAVAFVMYKALSGCDTGFFSSCSEGNCTYILLYLLVFSVITSIVFQFVKKTKGQESPWIVGTQVVIGIGEMCSVLAVASADCDIINSAKSYLIVIAVVCMVAANISIGMLAPFLLQKISHSNNMDYGKELSNMEYKYYEMSVENDRKLMSIRHDISNHIQTIYSLFRNGENQRGMDLIKELQSRYALVEQMVYCNNPVINIILSNKKKEAEGKNIETHIKIKEDLDNLPITDFDLSTVICNLLDNAIRGCVCSEQSHPRMIVEILKKNQYLVVRVLNSCKVTMNIESTDRIQSTKSNSLTTHGIGMPIVSGITQKYRGDFVVSAQNGLFTATAVMSIKE